MIEPAHNTVMIISPNTPGTYLTKGYFGKKAKKSKKETEKKENMEWDTGFGELYEEIEDRKVKKLFANMKDLTE